MTNAWPVVACTALASSNAFACSRARISTQTPARVCGPASRQAGIAGRGGGEQPVDVGVRVAHVQRDPERARSRSRPSRVIAGWSLSGKSLPRYARKAASPSAAACSP